MKVTILGCGSSGGVPRIGGPGGEWGACDSKEPKNRRRRCSVLVEEGGTSVVVDTSPDFREQCLDAGIDRLDGVIFTHEHADQTHGIDDLRMLTLRNRERAQIYADARTLAILENRFSYIFKTPEGSMYPPIADSHLVDGPFAIGGLKVTPFDQQHGNITCLGLRFGGIAYSNDVSALPEAAFAALEGVKVWIVDALRYKPHPTHAHLDQSLEWIARVKPERAILTNMHIDLDYATLCRELPDGVEPAFDGMEIEV